VPFAGNIIPANRLSANGIAILSAYPTATSGYLVGTQNWVAQAAHPYNQRKGTLSIDMLVTDKMRISGRRSEASYFEYQPFDQGSGETGKFSTAPTRRTPFPGRGPSRPP
jgi:hypothetical protein